MLNKKDTVIEEKLRIISDKLDLLQSEIKVCSLILFKALSN